MSEYESKLALRALRRVTAGKNVTPTGRRALLNQGYIDNEGEITPLGEQVLHVRG